MKWLHNLLKGVSLTTALFVFQACYGTPRWMDDMNVRFKVVSASDETPIEGVEVYTRISDNDGLDWNLCGYTEADGTLEAGIMYSIETSPQFRFKADETLYEVKDTVVKDISGVIYVKLQAAQ